MEMRLVKKEDLEELKEIWKLSFGDEDSFIDFYFQTRNWLEETAVLLLDGRIVSMLTMIPADMIGGNNEKLKASMLYAIATHPEFQKRGFADQLIEFSNQDLLSKHICVTLLVPAGEELFRFYEKRGYQDAFFVREAVLNRDEIKSLAGGDAISSLIAPTDPVCYNRIRRKLLEGHSYLDYRDEEISFEKQLGRIYDTDLLSVEIDGTEGCAYYERISQEEVIVKELLIPDQYLAAALMQISALIPGEKYIVRTPPHSGEIFGGVIRPFGMLRINGDDGKQIKVESGLVKHDSYLGIAYD